MHSYSINYKLFVCAPKLKQCFPTFDLRKTLHEIVQHMLYDRNRATCAVRSIRQIEIFSFASIMRFWICPFAVGRYRME